MKRDTAADQGGRATGRGGPIRVLWLTKGLALGGQERLLELLAQQHDVDRFTIECAYVVHGFDQQVAALEAAGVSCICLSGGSTWGWIRSLRRLLDEDRFDVVHFHSPLIAALARPMVRARRHRNRRPLLVTTSHLEWSGYHPLTQVANRLTASLDDVSIAVSPAVKRSMRGRSGRKAVVSVQGVDIGGLHRRFDGQALRHAEAIGRRPDEVVICTVANVSPQKDYATLLRAAQLVRARRPQARFVAVGGAYWEPYGSQMLDLRDRLGLAGAFEFLGAREDAVGILAASDIAVIASAFEAGPLTAMEAAVMGVPIASTAVGLLVDVFTPGQDCLRVPASDPDALADALVRLIDDPDLRKELVVRAQELADDQFDISRVIRELEDLYLALVTNRRPIS